MTPELQRIAIAEAHGFKNIQRGGLCFIPDSTVSNGFGMSKILPDYLNDLNAAISLCNFLVKRGWICEIGNGLDNTWECEFLKPATESTPDDNLGTLSVGLERLKMEIHYSSAGTLPKAISESFLKVLNLWKE